jgi:PKD repeat protein
VQNALVAKGTDLTKKITIPAQLFSTASYFVTLTVKNFFGKTSTTTAATVKNANPNLPSLLIAGAEIIVIKPNQAVTVRSLTSFQSCAEPVAITYEWIITLNNVRVNVVNIGNDRTALLLAPNSLLAGSTYLVTVTASVPATSRNFAAQASASMRIDVKSGNVVPQVFGGTTRRIFIQDYLTVDASSTYDENVGTLVKSPLTYKWTCAFMNAADFGADCSSVFQSLATTNAILYVFGPVLSPGKVYGFTLTARAADGRSGVITVAVEQLSTNTATTSIVTVKTSVNANSPLTVNGIVGATFAINASWSVNVEGTSLALNALTPLKKSFSKAEATNGIIYPLSFPPNVLMQGTRVTFRLTAIYSHAISQDTASFCEIVVVVNSAPTGGKLVVDPATGGVALFTKFSMISSEWSDVDIPLSYDFAYQVSPTTPVMSIKPRSSSNVADTELGEGMVSRNYLVIIINNIYDKNLAVTAVNTTAEVKVKVDVNPVTYFADKAAEFTLTKDTSKATAALNNAAVSVN